MNKKEILLLHCHEIMCPRVLTFVFQELTYAFQERGYQVRQVHQLKDLHNDAIVFVGDGIRIPDVVQRLNQQAPDAIYVAWYWGKNKLGPHSRSADLKKLLHVHENFLDKQALPSHRAYFEEIAGLPNTAPLLLRAREHPDKIGTYRRVVDDNQRLDYCYMGWRYCPELVPQPTKYRGIYHGVQNHAEYWPYEKRRDVYLHSLCALGFQVEDNLVSKHVSQRIYEGLAYGCVVLTNSPAAVEQTDGIAVLVQTQQEVEQQIDYYKTHPVECQEKREAGYHFIKTRQGTNHDAIDVLLDKMHSTKIAF